MADTGVVVGSGGGAGAGAGVANGEPDFTVWWELRGLWELRELRELRGLRGTAGTAGTAGTVGIAKTAGAVYRTETGACVWGAHVQDAQKDAILAVLAKITMDPRVSRQSPEALADPDKKYALTTEYAAYIALFL